VVRDFKFLLRAGFILFSFSLGLNVPGSSGAVTVSFRPERPVNGEALVFIFDGLTEGDSCTLEFASPRKAWIPFTAGRGRTVIVSGIPLNASGYVRWKLKSGGSTILSNRMAIVRKSYRKVSFDVDKKFSEPPAQLSKRLSEESRILRRARSTFSSNCFYRAAVTMPVPMVGGWSNDFGRMRILNSVWTDVHTGSDLKAKEGDPVRAFCTGRVLLAKEMYYGGKTVMIDHGLGLISSYCHLSEFAVKEGDFVDSGDCLGLAGKTGCVTAAHLHFGLNAGGVPINGVDCVLMLQEFFGTSRPGPECPGVERP